MTIAVKTILDYLDEQKVSYEYHGDPALTVEGFCALSQPKEKCFTWIKIPDSYDASLLPAGMLVLASDFPQNGADCNLIQCENGKHVFFDVLRHFWKKEEPRTIAKTAIVKTKKIGKNVHIGEYCVICEDAVIGDDVTLGHHVVITCPTEIGAGSKIGSGVVIGEDGFGFAKDDEGIHRRVAHFGGVIIGCGVEIGANTRIDRGTLSDTKIGEHTKIDGQCIIAHNTIVGCNAMILGGTAICGSCVIGDNVYIAPNSVIKNQLTIGKNAFIGMASSVIKDVPDGASVAGNPARGILR